ncbi:hypothetical protein [Microcoleus sp. B3-A4]|uniref:hypothetical protein n=1 Tax=Microcoleus sp. B3-A4 TaxID=2818653 RepID=UPI002FCE9CC8
MQMRSALRAAALATPKLRRILRREVGYRDAFGDLIDGASTKKRLAFLQWF